MLSIFAHVKPFPGIFDVIQSNALRSWRALSDEIDIFIFGDVAVIGIGKQGYSVMGVDISEEYNQEVNDIKLVSSEPNLEYYNYYLKI